jgi:hypothetical protein
MSEIWVGYRKAPHTAAIHGRSRAQGHDRGSSNRLTQQRGPPITRWAVFSSCKELAKVKPLLACIGLGSRVHAVYPVGYFFGPPAGLAPGLAGFVLLSFAIMELLSKRGVTAGEYIPFVAISNRKNVATEAIEHLVLEKS